MTQKEIIERVLKTSPKEVRDSMLEDVDVTECVNSIDVLFCDEEPVERVVKKKRYELEKDPLVTIKKLEDIYRGRELLTK